MSEKQSSTEATVNKTTASKTATNQTTAKKTTAKKNKKKTRPLWLAIILAILKFIRVPFLCLVALAIGLWIGYVKVGHQPTSEMFEFKTWKHLFDLVFAN
ncbi:DNA-directed RNA polymerase subunit beta [Paenibacillus eucommiae]|uniref:DNA-directed RNA polymerase subunit beta n=1 Tax=Paenibacillus eucommiae TaxID=1355755 RepID=A0ABS4IYF6_9BACL|nr:DNA-directed RNA polymerase subunit beta [Paenibacillus eucommiae]MBP1992617.1 hypothetical protein [Paenibacillus eucommiae]